MSRIVAQKLILCGSIALMAASCTLSSSIKKVSDDASVTPDDTSGSPTAPTTLTLISPTSSPGIDTTPTIRVSGVSAGQTVKLYRGSGCATELTSGGAIGSAIDLTSPTLAEGAYTFYATAVSSSGVSSNCSTASLAYVIDLTAPTVTSVTSSTNNGAYNAGDAISIQIQFSESVGVSGNPRLQLELGGPTIFATYASGSGGTTLTFNYSVASGENSSDLQYFSLTSLSANGGSITDGSGLEATLTLPALSSAQSLAGSKALIVDTQNPSAASSVADGTSLSSLTQSPNITWTAATDSGPSGLASYQIALGTTSGGTESLTWTDIGNVTSYQLNGLSLTTNTTYYPTLRALDAAGNISSVVTGNGWLADTTNPTAPGSFDDGTSSTSVTDSPAFTWTASTDTSGSGVQRYDVAIGTSAGGTQVVNWTSVGTNLTYTATGLSLTAGTTYYGSVRAVDNAGNVSTLSQGNGWLAAPTWSQQAYIKASNAEAGDNFGTQVALNQDSLIVGAPMEDSNATAITNGTTSSSNNSNADAGAAYIYKRTGTSWAQEAYLKASNSDAGDNYGHAVAIDGDTAVVSAPNETSNQTTITNGSTASSNNGTTSAGAVYVYTRSGTTWSQQAYIKASNTETLDSFGDTVAISGDTIAVGAPGEASNQTTITNGTTSSSDNSASSAGAVFVYKRTGTSWAQEAYIKASNAEAGDTFGGDDLHIHNDTLAVGVPNESSNQTTITNGTSSSSNNSRPSSGAVYVYKRTGTNWAQEAYIKAVNNGSSDFFGINLALYDDTIAVGAYMEDSNQTTITNGTSATTDNSVAQSGAVYVYKRTSSSWAQEAYIKAPNAELGDLFGYHVSLYGDNLAVAAFGEDSNSTTVTSGSGGSSNNSASGAGAVYVFTRSGTTWSQDAYIKTPNMGAGDGIGYVSLYQNNLAIGTPGEDSNQTSITNGSTASSDDSASGAGATYVFTK